MIRRLAEMLDLKVVRFVIVGVSAAGVLFGVSYLLNVAGLPQLLASSAAYGISFAFAYSLQRGWTFRGRHAHRRALPRYFAAQLGCAVIAGAVGELAAHFGASRVIASGSATLAASAASYCASLLWVFPDSAADTA